LQEKEGGEESVDHEYYNTFLVDIWQQWLVSTMFVVSLASSNVPPIANINLVWSIIEFNLLKIDQQQWCKYFSLTIMLKYTKETIRTNLHIKDVGPSNNHEEVSCMKKKKKLNFNWYKVWCNLTRNL